jgi:hypothetical protein
MKTNRIIVIILTLLFSMMGTRCRGEEPDHKMIDYRFFKCEKSRDLRGGIYGKGPFKRFGADKSKCKNTEWIEINQEEFKSLATEWYGYDWSKEIPFWRDTKGKP